MKKSYDLGRSGIREQSEDKTFRLFDSKYKEVSIDAPVSREGLDELEEFIIDKCPWTAIEGKRFVKGDSMRFYKGEAGQADNRDDKCHQDETYINLTYALATAIVREDLKQFDEEIRTGICIPTAEYFSTGAEEIKKALEGLCQVKFPRTGKSVMFRLKQENIAVSPEGVVALAPLMRTEYKVTIAKGVGIILDAGYGSLDVTVIKKGRPEGANARSFPIGGVTLEALVANQLERKRIFSSPTNVKSAIENGNVPDGSETKPVGELIKEAKHQLGQQIVNSALKVLTTLGMSDSEINYIFCLGRCFLTSGEGEENTGDLSSIITQDIWKHNVTLIPLVKPEVEEDINGNPVSAEEVANVMGVSLTI